MALAYASWVSETGKLTGTDPTYTLPNVASTASGNQFLRTLAAAFTAASDVILTISNSTGAETSIWTFTPGASGAAGTIERVQLIESSTGAAIDWSGQTVTIGLEMPAPVNVSAGAASEGRIPFLGSSGVLDSSVIPAAAPGAIYGYAVAGAPFIINDTFWRGNENNTWSAGTLLRFAMAWKWPFTPKYIGVLPNNGVASSICRLGVYSLLDTGEAGSLLYDSGDIAPTSGSTPAFGANTFSGTLAPGTYIFDLLIGATAPNLFIEQAASNSPAVTPAAFYGGNAGLYYQYPVLVASQAGVSYGAMPTTPPANSTFSGQNSTFPAGSRPIMVAER